MPRQDYADWANRAAKEWRGRPAHDFDIVLDDAVRLAPYAVPDRSAEATGSVLAMNGDAGWRQVSDLRGLGAEVSLEAVLAELEGGAQGILLDADQLAHLAGAGSRVRFDFVQLVVAGRSASLFPDLANLIPPEQRPEAEVSLMAGAGHPPTLEWPALHGGVTVPELAGLSATLAESYKMMSQRLSDDKASQLPQSSETFSLWYPVPPAYLDAVILTTALRKLWRKLSEASNYAAQLDLRLCALIAPTSVVASAEAYLIDATVRAVAAVSAGVSVLSVTPYSTSREHRRQARNLQHVLALEAGLGRHIDAVTGASLIEAGVEALLSTNFAVLNHPQATL